MKPYLVTFQMGIGNWRAAEQRENLCDQAISTLSLSLFVFLFPSLSFFILLYQFVFLSLSVYLLFVFSCVSLMTPTKYLCIFLLVYVLLSLRRHGQALRTRGSLYKKNMCLDLAPKVDVLAFRTRLEFSHCQHRK